jgi:CheY-like chemotaxis protein
VVTDLRMPLMDGWEFAFHLKSLHPSTLILFVSGYDAHLGSRTLPGPLLGKPFGPDELVRSVRRLLFSTQQQRA